MVHEVDQGGESFEETLTLVGIGGGEKVFEVVGLEARRPRSGVWFKGKTSRLDHFFGNGDGVVNLALWNIRRVGLRMFCSQGSKNFVGVVSESFR